MSLALGGGLICVTSNILIQNSAVDQHNKQQPGGYEMGDKKWNSGGPVSTTKR